MRAPRRTESWAALALLAAVLAVYAPAIGFRYAQDSYPAVKANPVVERGDLGEILTSDYWKDTGSFARTLYRPVTVASFALERRLAGEADPRLSHLINILMHAAAAWLLFLVARVYGAPVLVALAAAFLFALHPLALHTVANVVGRADILALLFSLSALLAFARTARWPGVDPPPTNRRRIAAWATGLAVWLALGSKEIAAAVLPLLVLVALLWPTRGGGRRERWLERVAVFAPTILAVLVYLHLRTIAIDDFPGSQPLASEDNVLVGMRGWPRVATTIAMAGRYALLLVWPARLSPDYSGAMIARESSLLSPLPLLGSAALVLLLVLLARGFRGARLPAFASSLVLIPYLFVGNVLTLNAAGFAERLVYFSSTGACLLLAVALAALVDLLPQRRRWTARVALVVALVLALLLCAVQIRLGLPMWRDNRALFEYTARAAPESLRGQLQLAGGAEADGRLEDALRIYQRIERFAPDYGGAFMAHGVLLARLGDREGAEAALRRSIELQPVIGESHFQLGQVLIAQGRFAEAERELRKTLLLAPRRVEAAVALGHLLYGQRRYREAVYFYEGCVRLGREELLPRLNDARARAR